MFWSFIEAFALNKRANDIFHYIGVLLVNLITIKSKNTQVLSKHTSLLSTFWKQLYTRSQVVSCMFIQETVVSQSRLAMYYENHIPSLAPDLWKRPPSPLELQDASQVLLWHKGMVVRSTFGLNPLSIQATWNTELERPNYIYAE